MKLGKILNLPRFDNIGEMCELALELFKSSSISNILLCYSAAAKSLQSCLTLYDPVDGSPSGSPIPGILQARILECVAVSFSNA